MTIVCPYDGNEIFVSWGCQRNYSSGCFPESPKLPPPSECLNLIQKVPGLVGAHFSIGSRRNPDLRNFNLHKLSFQPHQVIYVDESGYGKRVGFRRTGWSALGAISVQIARYQREQWHSTDMNNSFGRSNTDTLAIEECRNFGCRVMCDPTKRRWKRESSPASHDPQKQK